MGEAAIFVHRIAVQYWTKVS